MSYFGFKCWLGLNAESYLYFEKVLIVAIILQIVHRMGSGLTFETFCLVINDESPVALLHFVLPDGSYSLTGSLVSSNDFPNWITNSVTDCLCCLLEVILMQTGKQELVLANSK